MFWASGFVSNKWFVVPFVSHFVILRICFVFAFWQQDSITLNKKQSLSHFLSLPFSLFCRNISSEFLNKGLLEKPLYQLGASFSLRLFLATLIECIGKEFNRMLKKHKSCSLLFPSKKNIIISSNTESLQLQQTTLNNFVFCFFYNFYSVNFAGLKSFEKFEKFWKSFESPVHIPVSGSGLHSGVLIELVEVVSIRQMFSLFLFLLFMKRHLETKKIPKFI